MTALKVLERCGHMPCFRWATGSTVTCPFHGSKSDVKTGKKLSEPILTPSQEMEPLPQTWQKFFEHIMKLMAHIKTYDQLTYETRIDGDRIKIRI